MQIFRGSPSINYSRSSRYSTQEVFLCFILRNYFVKALKFERALREIAFLEVPDLCIRAIPFLFIFDKVSVLSHSWYRRRCFISRAEWTVFVVYFFKSSRILTGDNLRYLPLRSKLYTYLVLIYLVRNIYHNFSLHLKRKELCRQINLMARNIANATR